MTNITISDLDSTETEFAELSASEVGSVVGGYYRPYININNFIYNDIDVDIDITTQIVNIKNYGYIGKIDVIAF